jgi:putative heme-binding domain-containing protein
VALYAPFLKRYTALPESFKNRVRDESIRVRFLSTLVLARSEFPEVSSWLNELVFQNQEDPWMRVATQAFHPEFLVSGARGALHRGKPDSAELVTFVRDCGVIAGSNPKLQNPSAALFLATLSETAATNPIAAKEGLLGLCEGLAKHDHSTADLLRYVPASREHISAWLCSVAQDAKHHANDPALAVSERVSNIALLAVETDLARIQSTAQALLQPSQPDAIRLAAITLLQRKRAPVLPQMLMEAWPTLTPGPREAALTTLASRAEWLSTLISAVESGTLKPSEISAAARALILRTTDAALKARAEKLFATSSRSEVLAKYEPALSATGNATRGKVVFTALCAVCHRFKDDGRDVGPNLATTLAWTPEQLLTNILDPNREVSPNFAQYVLELQDGRILVGMLTGESGTSITLKGADAVEQSIARPQIKSLKSTGLSLMPEGLEAAMTVEQLTDLMAYLRAK